MRDRCDKILGATQDRFNFVLNFRNAMDRFHLSMSWNFPTESGEKESNDGGAPDLSSAAQAWLNEERREEHPIPSDLIPDDLGQGEFRITHWAGTSFFLPLHYTPSYAYPLLVWFHSNGFNENQIDSVMPHISVRNLVGIGIRGTRAADSRGHRFDWHHSPAAIAAAHEATCEAIDEAARRFNVHPSRVVLAGYREGGSMAQRIALRDPERFAGVVSLGGRIPQGGIHNLTQLRRRRLPMLWLWGQDNPQYTDGNLKTDCRLVMQLGADVEIRQYPDDDEMNTVTLRDIDAWIMRRIVAGSSIAESQQWASSPATYSQN